MTPKDTYIQDKEKMEKDLSLLLKVKSRLAWIRLLSFLAAIFAALQLWPYGIGIAIIAFAALLGLFFYFVSKDLANKDAIDNTKLLIAIQQKELYALDHDYLYLPGGHQWKPEQHEYAHDLDIFGHASLFQYINRTTSEQGGQLLANWLLAPASATDIEKRQQAIKELSSQKNWREQLTAYGTSQPLSFRTENSILEWLQEKNRFIDALHWKILRFLLPAISCTILILYIADVIKDNVFFPLMLLFLAIAFSISKMIMPAYAKLNKITAELETLTSSVRWIEKASFKTPLLQQLQQAYGKDENKASTEIYRLKKILDRLDYRLNPVVFIPLSIFLCWDLQQIFALEKWKKKNQQIGDWFSSLATMESLSSLATLTFNHPEWCFPTIATQDSVFITDTMGHPLIPKNKRVDNSFATEGRAQINLITGSNMAGKSTFLRSTGINIVLAMAGSPVCAKQLTLSPMRVMSSMRISDNLEESTSTFYAELKKLKEIIEAVNRNEKVFLLLDEILRGTNSADRHTGSGALLKQLVHHKAAGMLATHDLELAKLANVYPGNIHNYHFDVQVANDELYFDYKLKEGVCTSMNASILMKKIGIEL